MTRVSQFLIAGWLLAMPQVGLALSGSGPLPDTSDRTPLQVRGALVQGLTEAALDNHSVALSTFEKALSLAPNEPSLLMAIADARAALGRHSSALLYAQKAHEQAPHQIQYLRRVAELQWRTGRLQAASTSYRELLRHAPNDLDARFSLAHLFLEQNRHDAAVRELEATLDSQHESLPDAFFDLLGASFPEEASARLLSPLASFVHRQRQSAVFDRFHSRLSTNDIPYEAAIRLFEALLDAHPEEADLQSQLRLLYQESGRPDAASSLPATWKEKKDPADLVARARSLLTSTDSSALRRAQMELERALVRAPDHVPALDLLGRVHMKRGSPGEAASALRRALEEDPREPERWHRAVEAFLASGAPAEAARWADEGLLIFPGARNLTRLLATAQLRNGEPRRARTHLRDLLSADAPSLSPDPRASLYTCLGRAELQLKNYSAAQTAFQKAFDAGASSADAYEYAGDVQAAQGNDAAARTYWQKALEVDPERDAVRHKLSSPPAENADL